MGVRVRHAVAEAVEEGRGVGEAGEEGGLLHGARRGRAMPVGRRGRREEARGRLGHRVGGRDRPVRRRGSARSGDRCGRVTGPCSTRGCGHGVVGAVDGDVAVLLDDAGLLAGGGIGDRGQRDETGLLLGEGLVDAAAGGAVHADVGDGVEPLAALLVEVVPGGEGAAGEEVVFEVVEGPFHLAPPFLVPGPPDGGLEAIVLGEGQEGGMPAGLAADAAQGDGGLVVIGDAAAEAPVVAEGLLVRPEQGRQALVAEEGHEQAAAEAQDQAEGVHDRLLLGDQHAVGAPVRLRFLPGPGLEAPEDRGRRGRGRAQGLEEGLEDASRRPCTRAPGSRAGSAGSAGPC